MESYVSMEISRKKEPFPSGRSIKSLRMESLNTPEWFITYNLRRLNGDLYWMLYIRVGLAATCI